MDLVGVDRGAGGHARLLARASTSEALRAGVQTFIRELWELDKPTSPPSTAPPSVPARTLHSHATSSSYTRRRDSCGRSRSGDSSSTPVARTSSPGLVGLPNAKAMVMLGESATGSEAVDRRTRLPCVDTARGVAPPPRRRSPIGSRRDRPRSLGLSKRLLNATFETDLPHSLELECLFQALATTSPDVVEGMAAFREKRDANFTGT